MKNVLVINGPNINLLGKREPSIYGSATYEDLCKDLLRDAKEKNLGLEIYQSNHEGEIVDKIQEASEKTDLIIINAGAYTHTSVAIRDALAAVSIPIIEVHISNIYKRENFRHHSYLSEIVSGIIAGFGTNSYFLALNAASRMLSKSES
ncbi:MAG: type II 3-dehydroquinate dehydratase [Nitrospinota bacterium]|nr:type II 3-dehydroquinate dehydratase [Nitrospinota bacterium]